MGVAVWGVGCIPQGQTVESAELRRRVGVEVTGGRGDWG